MEEMQKLWENGEQELNRLKAIDLDTLPVTVMEELVEGIELDSPEDPERIW